MTDRRAFLGTGWRFPPSFSLGGVDVDLVSDEEDIEQSLTILLATRRGERTLRDDFGCDLDAFLFAQVTEGLLGHIRDFVADAVLHHEPRIVLNGVDVTPHPDEPGVLRIGLDYTVRSTNSRYNMVYPFYLNEASPSAKG